MNAQTPTNIHPINQMKTIKDPKTTLLNLHSNNTLRAQDNTLKDQAERTLTPLIEEISSW